MDVPNSTFVGSIVEFTGNLFNRTRGDEKNLIVSPLSLHRALNFLLIGANDDSQTQKELMDVLGYKKPFEPYYESHQQLVRMFAANKQQASKLISATCPELARYPIIDIWDLLVVIDSDFGQNYREDIKRHFDSNSIESVKSHDSDSKLKIINKINDWGKNVGFEGELLKRNVFESNSLKAVLFSAIKAQAHWFVDFTLDRSEIKFRNYGVKGNLSSEGRFMRRGDMNEAKFLEFCQEGKGNHESLRESFRESDPNMFDQLAHLNIRAIRIPLQGNVDLIMLEPLSFEKGDELKVLSQELASVDSSGASKLSKILTFIDTKDSGHKFGSLTMPKFKFESNLELNSYLQAMNLKMIFETNAELSSMFESDTFVSKISQNAIIDVDEHGIKAAALTKVSMNRITSCSMKNIIDLTVQDPFVFMLRYVGVPLFIGQLVSL